MYASLLQCNRETTLHKGDMQFIDLPNVKKIWWSSIANEYKSIAEQNADRERSGERPWRW